MNVSPDLIKNTSPSPQPDMSPIVDANTNVPENGVSHRQLTKRIWTVMEEGRRRGFTFQVLNSEDRMYQAERDGQGFIYKIYPGHASFRRQYSDTDYDFEQTKSRKLSRMANHGLATPQGYGTFQTFADIPLTDLSFPIVAKPDNGSLSRNVFSNLQTIEQLQQAVNQIEADDDVIKLEAHLSGRDYRVLIVNHHYAGCVERRPANVVGDGKHTIQALVDQKNKELGRSDRDEEHTTLHHLVLDENSDRLLEQAGYTLDTILPTGTQFNIQTKITAVLGADYIDRTDALHPSIIEKCIAFSHQFSTLTLGFDLITTDLSKPLNETQGGFNEYNFLPYVDLHEHCNIGQQRPVCKFIWDYIETHRDTLITSQFELF